MTPFVSADPAARRYGRGRRAVLRVLSVLAIVGAVAVCGMAIDVAAADPGDPKAPADSVQAAPDTTAGAHRVLAYYFHTTRRCASCRKLEAYSQEAIEAGFPEALKDGRLAWRVVNVEEKGNEHFVKDYQLFTKSVVLVEEADSAQVRWKNLPKVWELLGDKAGFLRYVQEETQAFLAGRQ